jgi:hypothetical protein
MIKDDVKVKRDKYLGTEKLEISGTSSVVC